MGLRDTRLLHHARVIYETGRAVSPTAKGKPVRSRRIKELVNTLMGRRQSRSAAGNAACLGPLRARQQSGPASPTLTRPLPLPPLPHHRPAVVAGSSPRLLT